MDMALEQYIRKKLREKDILLMTHTVLGYPSLYDSFRIIETMVKAGVDLIELQIPFPEPIADGPVIRHANHAALKQGVCVKDCLDVAEQAARSFDIPFLFMTYYNIPFCFGVSQFVSAMAKRGLVGAIIPDLPLEDGHDYLQAMRDHGLSPIRMFSPTTSDERMRRINSNARGFIYCVARKGVTGSEIAFTDELTRYLERCRKASNLPLAVGFGIKGREEVAFLKGKADIAVIGTQLIRLVEEEGIASVGDFVRELGLTKDA
jgi:tryptophan synthase alpha chain